MPDGRVLRIHNNGSADRALFRCLWRCTKSVLVLTPCLPGILLDEL